MTLEAGAAAPEEGAVAAGAAVADGACVAAGCWPARTTGTDTHTQATAIATIACLKFRSADVCLILVLLCCRSMGLTSADHRHRLNDHRHLLSDLLHLRRHREIPCWRN